MDHDESQKISLLTPSRASSETAWDSDQSDWESPSPRRSSWSEKTTTYARSLPRRFKTVLILGVIDVVIVTSLVAIFLPLITLLVRNEHLFGARLKLPLNTTTTTNPEPNHQTIPRIFHQTTKNATIREEWREAHQSCQEAYSDFEYMVCCRPSFTFTLPSANNHIFQHWTDEKARDFIQEEYSWFIETWDDYPFPIQRADAIRYFVLYHYGGIYLDADTWCNQTIPLDQIEEADDSPHLAVFKSTTPTGISNDLLISSAHHPVFETAISQLQFYDSITKPIASISPHIAIMISAGPFFLTMVIKGYLEGLKSLPTPLVQVVSPTELLPYITDLEAQTWHHGDTKALEWLGDREWIWYALMIIGTAIGLSIINMGLLKVGRCVMRRYNDELTQPASSDENKVAKLA